jgi:hypothetical protein
VRHHLSDRDDEVVGAVDEGVVDGEREREAERVPDDVIDLIDGELADRRDVVAPTVVQDALGIDRVAEHEPALSRPKRLVRPERGHHVDVLDLALEPRGELRDDLTGAGVQPRLVGRDEQHAAHPHRDNLVSEAAHECSELVRRDVGGRAADGKDRPSRGRRHVRRISLPGDAGSAHRHSFPSPLAALSRHP